MRVKNRLLNFGNNIIYQDDNFFNFSLDSVLLANFVDVSVKNINNVLDMCTGNAPVAMLLSFRCNANICGMEIQEEVYNLAIDSVKENGMDDRIKIINDDVKNVGNYYKCEFFDVITCNPPYFKYSESSNINGNEVKSIARHEIKISLEDIIRIGSKYLKNKGYFYMVHRPERLSEMFDLMKKYRLEPKRIRFIHPKEGSNSNMVLIECVKNGNVGLKVLPSLIAHDGDGNYSSEVREMFGDSDVAK